MNILVYGLGAVGTVFATFLKEKGHTVYGITKRKYIKFFKDNTLYVSGIWGEHKATLDGVFYNLKQLSDKRFDVVLLTVKSYDTKKAVKQLKGIVKKDTFLILAQNGYGNYETAKQFIPPENILLARVIFGAKVEKPSQAVITVNADDVVIGQPENLGSEERIKKVVNQIKSAGIPARYDKDVYKILWDKILYNCALNPLGALLGATYGQLADNPATRKTMNNIIKEIFTVAKANSIQLRWKNPTEYINHFYQNLIPPTREHYPSMYYDLQAGKKTEIDALNGAVVKLGKKKGVKTPVNETVVSLVKFAEKSK
ncbi:MAG: 2-dehydropantoate 2-reductase [Aquificae bacterium]|nr:2-dehydropantoate 2-reductase [Aquificota bacterium]